MVTTTVEGRERFGVTVRYPRELRSDPQQIAREVLVPTMGGTMVPLGQLAKVSVAKGTPGIRTKTPCCRPISSWTSATGTSAVTWPMRRRRSPSRSSSPGYYVTWSGQFEFMERAIEKMKIVIPITLLTIFLLLYLNFRRITETLIVMLSVPFALVGGCG
jgi:Cu(I)/Ag(I) efflux system membrane protein CusA/SilA